ncbi:MAG: Ig-like domain-containing protein [Myxococcota bacterium]|nr:Ig-like domain-containing protein [Myxococcota bacterium]
MLRSFVACSFVVLVACSPKVNAPCAVEADCSSGFICAEGRCSEAPSPDAGQQCANSLDCSEPNTRCREGLCVAISNDAGPGGDTGVNPAGCGTGPACSDRVIGGQPLERCIEGACRQSCLSDRMCRTSEAPICVEVEGARSCMPAECEVNNDCDEGQVCLDSRCADVDFCDGNDDCAVNEICNGSGFCQERDGCMVDSDCGDEETCNEGFCFSAPSCEDEACPAGLDCVAGRCVEGICRSAEDCEAGQICSAGECATPPQVDPHRIVIVTPYGICAGGGESACRLPLSPGATAQLTAMALDVNGQGIAGVNVQWSSDANNRASVDASGVVTAVGAGEARIDAVLGQLSADRTVQVIIEAAPEEDAILVLDERGRGLNGARVAIKQGDQAWRYMPGATHGGGRLTLDNLVAGAVDISVQADGYEQTMIVAALSKGVDPLYVILPLMRDRSARAAGYRARVDFSAVTSVGDGQLSLSGASVPDLLSFDLTAFAGDTFTSEVAIPGQGAQAVPLPGNVTFSATVFGFPINLKDTAYSRGAAGTRSAWSFAGNVDPLALFGRFQNVRGPGDAVMAIFPLLGAFEHGLVAGLPLVEQDLIIDTTDINGNGDRTELLPDWRSFALTEFRPATRQNGRTELQVPAAAGSEGTILTGGIFHPGTGYTPLGMSAHDGTDAASVPFTIAPAYGGLEGHDYVFAVMALSDQGSKMRAQLRRSNRLDNTQPFAAHLGLPQLRALGQSVNISSVRGVDLVRVLAKGRDGALRVYATPNENGALNIEGAPGPQGPQQRLAEGTVEIIKLNGLPQGVAVLPYLTSGQGMVLSSIGQQATAFARSAF